MNLQIFCLTLNFLFNTAPDKENALSHSEQKSAKCLQHSDKSTLQTMKLPKCAGQLLNAASFPFYVLGKPSLQYDCRRSHL